jgi:peptidoglycan/LPS O-acetylase OafA/YrhL
MATLDAARFLAALGVIWIHVCQSPATVEWSILGRFAVPFFAATAGFLLVASLADASKTRLRHFLRGRITRLYVPFLIWSAGYVLMKACKVHFLGDPQTDLPGWEFFYVGGAYHLWFIPFLIIASQLVFVLNWFASGDRRGIQMGLAMLVVGATVAWQLTRWNLEPGPAAFMLEALPGLLWGAGLAWATRAESARGPRRDAFGDGMQAIITSSIAFGVCLIASALAGRSIMLENASGVALLIFALATHRWTTRSAALGRIVHPLGQLGQVSLGIYFAHLMVIKVGESLLPIIGADTEWGRVAFLATAATVVSTSVAVLAAKSPRTRWLVS